MKVETKTKTEVQHFFVCPACNVGEHGYGDLLSLAAKEKVGLLNIGPWYCSHCNVATKFKVFKDGTLDVSLINEKRFRTLVLLRFCINTNVPEDNLFIVVEGAVYGKDDKTVQETIDEKIAAGGQKYFYEEHSCPSNFLRHPTLFRNDADYHGMFEYVTTIPMPTQIEIFDLTDQDWGNFDSENPQALVDLEDISDLFAEHLMKLFKFPENGSFLKIK